MHFYYRWFVLGLGSGSSFYSGADAMRPQRSESALRAAEKVDRLELSSQIAEVISEKTWTPAHQVPYP